ncbi:hypothetical protein IF1G_09996 [Cordyceps javanica]|uniref:Uncharacterized protein n=1 Tax=Cordyceps javanica TaxID=43265 RepID=A0A545UPV8_9HYPO|nr:hypothetical protein IF1G_09996 [Cordyceps javanica]
MGSEGGGGGGGGGGSGSTTVALMWWQGGGGWWHWWVGTPEAMFSNRTRRAGPVWSLAPLEADEGDAGWQLALAACTDWQACTQATLADCLGQVGGRQGSGYLLSLPTVTCHTLNEVHQPHSLPIY